MAGFRQYRLGCGKSPGISRCSTVWSSAAMAGVLAIVLYLVWSSMGRVRIRTDYLAMLNEMAAAETTEGNNAWPHYEKAVALYRKPPDAISRFMVVLPEDQERLKPFAMTPPECQQAIRDYIDENRSILDALDGGLKEIAEAAYARGLVPYVLAGESGWSSWRQFDNAARQMAWTAAPHTIAGIVGYWGYDEEYTMMLEEEIAVYGIYAPQRDPNGTKPADPNPAELWDMEVGLHAEAELGRRLAAWAAEHPTAEERLAAQKAVNLAALAYWTQHPHALDNRVMPNLYAFEIEMLERWVADNEAAWAAFTEGTRQTHCHRTYQIDPRFPGGWLGKARPVLCEFTDMACLGRWRARLSLRAGDVEAAVDDCMILAQAGRHFRGRKFAREQIVGSELEADGLSQLLEVVAMGEMTADHLDPVLRALKKLHEGKYPLLDVEVEQMVVMDAIQRAFTDGGRGGGRLIAAEMWTICGWWGDGTMSLREWVTWKRKAITHARRNATEAMAARLWDNEAELASSPPYQRHVRKMPTTAELLNATPKDRYWMLHNVCPVLDGVSMTVFECRALYDATVTILALERRRLEKGAYPQTLAVLIEEGLIDAVPMDPFSDGPLVYRPSEEGFVLYSVGPDFVDNGGVMGRDPMRRVGIRSSKKGFDRVYWPIPRARPVDAESRQAYRREQQEARLVAPR